MGNYKYDKFYSKKTINELLSQLFKYKTSSDSKNIEWYLLDSEWNNALIKHLSERGLTDDQKRMLDIIQNGQPEELLENENLINKQLNAEIQKNGFNVTNPSGIWYAGKSLINTVIVVAILLGCDLIGFFLSYSSGSFEKAKNIFIFLGVSNLIGLAVVLSTLYAAGLNLKNSIARE